VQRSSLFASARGGSLGRRLPRRVRRRAPSLSNGARAARTLSQRELAVSPSGERLGLRLVRRDSSSTLAPWTGRPGAASEVERRSSIDPGERKDDRGAPGRGRNKHSTPAADAGARYVHRSGTCIRAGRALGKGAPRARGRAAVPKRAASRLPKRPGKRPIEPQVSRLVRYNGPNDVVGRGFCARAESP